MKIYTKRGDSGETDLFGGERVSKSHPRVQAFGAIDCANTAIGLAFSCPQISVRLKEDLEKVMKLLFCAGAEIATSPKERAQGLLEKHLKNHIGNQHVQWLEKSIDSYEESLPVLKSFILPCGSDGAARLHWARIWVRKAEVLLVLLKESGEPVRPEILQFFNRLSDYLFVVARFANAEALLADIMWSGQLDTY